MRLPEDLQDTLQALARTLTSLDSGEVVPARAKAVASVYRAVVFVFEMGDAERRISKNQAATPRMGVGMSKRDFDRSLDEFARCAKIKKRGVVHLIDVLTWPDKARLAYARASRRCQRYL